MRDVGSSLSRRTLARFLGGGAAWAALAPLASAAGDSPSGAPPPAPGRPVRLSANENPYGPAPEALTAMTAALAGAAARYPDAGVERLAEAVAARHGVGRDGVVLGDGSSQILHAAALAFCGPGRPLVTAEPTFEAIAEYAEARAVRVVRVPLDGHHRHDLDAMARAVGDAGLVYVCNPNNPTATLTPADALRRFVERLPPDVAVLVDEAYHDYAEGAPGYATALPWIGERPHLVVARTFSKIFGLAGIRCGYGVAAPETAGRLAAQLPWDTINVAASEGARAALAAAGWTARSRRLNDEVRAASVAGLGERGFEVLPSAANFFMVALGRDAGPVVAALREHGVRVGRRFPALPRHLRVTVGTADEMDRFLAAFDEVLARLAA